MNILYQDQSIVIANKKANQFVHPISGDPESKDCLLFELRDHLGIHLYPINRLDRPVSGITLFANRPEIVTEFQTIWHDENTRKKYLCLHRGKLESEGRFDSPLSKKGIFKNDSQELKQSALTLYHPIEYFPSEFCTFTEVEIKTGRYHQIRRHFRKAVMPIIGDRKHGKGKVNNHFVERYHLNQIFLHCHYFECIHPITSERLELHCPLPENLSTVLSKLQSQIKSVF